MIYDEVFLRHRPPRGYLHPECPERVSTVRDELHELEVSHTSASLVSPALYGSPPLVLSRLVEQCFQDPVWDCVLTRSFESRRSGWCQP